MGYLHDICYNVVANNLVPVNKACLLILKKTCFSDFDFSKCEPTTHFEPNTIYDRLKPRPVCCLGYAIQSNGEIVATKSAPLQEAQISSLLPNEAFRQLKVFNTYSPSGSFISFVVTGWMRVQSSSSLGGSYVKIITEPGIIRIDGFNLQFQDTMGSLFVEAGFNVDSSGRRLLGVFELIGMFNSIDASDWIGLDLDEELPPGFGQSDFKMDYVMTFPCTKDHWGCTYGMFEDSGVRRNVVGWRDDGYGGASGGKVIMHYKSMFDKDVVDQYGNPIEDGAVQEIVSNAEWPGHR